MRARNIKPGFFENEKLSELDPLARILFAGLWCYADREGRFEWRPKRIKALILPYDDCDIDNLLMSLHVTAFALHYITKDGEEFGWLPTYLDHQKPHPHETPSKIPPFSEDLKFKYNNEQNQCHNMSLHVTAMSDQITPMSDIVALNPESGILNPESGILNPESSTRVSGEDAPTPHPEKLKPPFQEIMIYLVQKTGRKFDTDPVSKSNKRLIQARWNDGRTVEDFKTVIDNQCTKWKTDPKMFEYLRPETLFGTKFESYLTATPNPLAGKVSPITMKNLETMKRWSAKQDAGQKKIS